MPYVSGSTNGPVDGTTSTARQTATETATETGTQPAPARGRTVPANIVVKAPEGVGAGLEVAADRQTDAAENLHDRMLGEIVMRHATGRRALDLGHGVPRVTTWVSERAASLAVIDAVDLGRGDTVRLPMPDASFSLVYCVRTLPHLGRDNETSERAARSTLAEIGRVLEPGGTALVEIDNPLSLWGAVHGLRRPAKALEPGPMTIESDRGLTRFDTLALFSGRLPASLVITDLHGLRLLAPAGHLLSVPIIGRIVERLEWALRDRPVLRRMGGHLLVVLRRVEGSGPSPG